MYPKSYLKSTPDGLKSLVSSDWQPSLNNGLSRLKVSGYANNEIRLQLSTTPQSRKQYGDKIEVRKLERRAKLLKQIEIIRKWQSELMLGKNPEIWLPQSGSGIVTSRIHNDICEIDITEYAKFCETNNVSPDEYERCIKIIIQKWRNENYKYPIPIDFTPVVKEARKKWDKNLYPDTQYLSDEPNSPNIYYRAKPCFKQVTIPVSRIKELPGTSIKVTWVKHTISMAECERVLVAVTAALDIRNGLQEILPLGSDNPQRSFTRQARHTLLEAGAVTDKLAGKNAVLLTLTLPGSTPESLRAIAAYSSWILNNLMQPIRDWRKKFKKQIEYFYVWEWQKRGALHIHICLAASPDEETIEQLINLAHKQKDLWYWLLKRMATTEPVKRFGKKEGNLPGIDMFARANQNGRIKSWRERPDKWEWDIQQVRKSVAAYFVKYAGKNAAPSNKKGFDEYAKSGKKCYNPGRWSGKSKGIQQAIKTNRFTYEIEMANLQSSGTLEAVRQEMLLQSLVRSYSYPWQVVESKYKEAIIGGKKWYCKKGIVKGELELVKLASQGDNPSRVLIQGHTEIYYFEPESFPEIWQFWREQKDLLIALSGKPERNVNSRLQM